MMTNDLDSKRWGRKRKKWTKKRHFSHNKKSAKIKSRHKINRNNSDKTVKKKTNQTKKVSLFNQEMMMTS